jgi:hypothetical protein
MRGVCRTRSIGGVLLICLGCADSDPRPGRSGDCTDPRCGESGLARPSVAGSAAPDGSAGTAGAAGSGGLPPPGVDVLAGTVRMLNDSAFSNARSLDRAVTIRAPGAQVAEVSGQSELDGSFRLEDVQVAREVWVSVGASDSTLFPFLETLQVVDSTLTAFVDLAVISRPVLEEIAQSAFLGSPLELDPAAAHVVINFVTPEGISMPAVRISFPEDANVAYDAGDVYSDLVLETSTRGTAILLNLPSVAYPGSATTLTASVADQLFDIDLRIALGAVTLVKARLDLQP